MKSNNTDTRLTDHLFGELSPADAEALRKELASDPGLADEMRQLRAVSGRLAAAFERDREESPSLGSAREHAVLYAARSARRRMETRMEPWVFGLCLTAAAAVLLGTFLPFIPEPGGYPADSETPIEFTLLRPQTLELESHRPDIPQDEELGAGREDVPREGTPAGIDAYSDTLAIVETVLNHGPTGMDIDSLDLRYSRSANLSLPGPQSGRVAWTSASFLDMPYYAVHSRPFMFVPLRRESASIRLLTTAIRNGRLPRKGSLTVAGLVNSMNYDYPEPSGEEVFRLGSDLHYCPWNESSLLARVWISGSKPARDVAVENAPRLLADWATAAIEFNPANVAAYKFLGIIPKQAATRTTPVLPVRMPLVTDCEVTLLFELIPPGAGLDVVEIAHSEAEPIFEPLTTHSEQPGAFFSFMLTYRSGADDRTFTQAIEHKQPVQPYAEADAGFKLAAAAALLGGVIDERDAPDIGLWNLAVELAGGAAGQWPSAEGKELLRLTEATRTLMLGMKDPVAPSGRTGPH